MNENINEKVIKGHKNGMAMLLLAIVLYIAATFAVIFSAIYMDGDGKGFLGAPLFIISLLYLCAGWIIFLGLKVLKPGEALVLTLFGKYIGTLKGDGFFWVNPFATAFNPAADTRLGQSGDISDNKKSGLSGIVVSGGQIGTTTKRTVADGGDTVGQGDGGQAVTSGKSIVAYSGDTVG